MEKQKVHSERFRVFLQEELVRRCKANPAYSLRAFARFFDVEPSALSKVLAGKRKVTSKSFAQFAQKLALEPQKKQAFVTQKGQRKGASAFDAEASRIKLDAFSVIAEWYHMAILELVGVKGFQSGPRWIARALGISQAEANDAVERLIRLDLLKAGPKGRLLVTSTESTTIGSAETAVALRKMQQQVLALAGRAMDDVPAPERDQSTMTMAVSLSRLAEAKQRIRAFRRELCQFLEGKSPREEVFQLTISLFPVSRVRSLREAEARREI